MISNFLACECLFLFAGEMEVIQTIISLLCAHNSSCKLLKSHVDVRCLTLQMPRWFYSIGVGVGVPGLLNSTALISITDIMNEKMCFGCCAFDFIIHFFFWRWNVACVYRIMPEVKWNGIKFTVPQPTVQSNRNYPSLIENFRH